MKNKIKLIVSAFASTLLVASANAQLVTHDASTGAVTFDPTVITTSVVAGAVAAAAAGVALITLGLGMRWVLRMLKIAK